MLQAAHPAADSYAAKIVAEMVFSPELLKVIVKARHIEKTTT